MMSMCVYCVCVSRHRPTDRNDQIKARDDEEYVTPWTVGWLKETKGPKNAQMPTQTKVWIHVHTCIYYCVHDKMYE